MKEEIYKNVFKTIQFLVEDENDLIARMATVSCELFHAFQYFHWVGFYRRINTDTLKVGPYQGGHGCLTITIDRGVCGACVRENKTQVENDVSLANDHIACSPLTKSEIVIPVRDSIGEVTAVLDIDSSELNTFDRTDEQWLEKICGLISSPKV